MLPLSPVIPMSECGEKEFVFLRGHQTPRRRRFARQIFEFRKVRQDLEKEKNASAFFEFRLVRQDREYEENASGNLQSTANIRDPLVAHISLIQDSAVA